MTQHFSVNFTAEAEVISAEDMKKRQEQQQNTKNRQEQQQDSEDNDGSRT